MDPAHFHNSFSSHCFNFFFQFLQLFPFKGNPFSNISSFFSADLHFVFHIFSCFSLFCCLLSLLPTMPCAFRFAYILIAVSASLQPGALTKDSVRPATADNNPGDYERLTQAPMVWLNLRKTSLALPSVDLIGQAHGAVVVEHAAKEAHA